MKLSSLALAVALCTPILFAKVGPASAADNIRFTDLADYDVLHCQNQLMRYGLNVTPKHVTFTFRPNENRAYWRVDDGPTFSTTVGGTIVRPLMDTDEFGAPKPTGSYQVQLAQLTGAGVFNGEMLYLNSGAFVCRDGQSDWAPIEFDAARPIEKAAEAAAAAAKAAADARKANPVTTADWSERIRAAANGDHGALAQIKRERTLCPDTAVVGNECLPFRHAEFFYGGVFGIDALLR